jgi:L-alanine-DL-glutamate epimerase-like enolase superfamily enzyme
LAAALRRLGRRFHNRDLRDIEPLVGEAWRSEGDWPTAVGAFEAAMWDALSQSEGIPFFKMWGGAQREMETTLSISAVPPEVVGQRARAAARAGWRFLKLKLNGGEAPGLNRDRLRAAARAAPRARILVDPNQSFDLPGLEQLFRSARADGIGIELVEEPFPKKDWAATAAAEARGLGPLLGDESIQTADDARRACRGGGIRGPNIKVAKSGLLRSRAIVDVFDRELQGRARFMIGCMAESRIGLAAAVHFALGLGGFHYADLDSDLILKPTDTRGGYLRRGPWIALAKHPPAGLGLR